MLLNILLVKLLNDVKNIFIMIKNMFYPQKY